MNPFILQLREGMRVDYLLEYSVSLMFEFTIEMNSAHLATLCWAKHSPLGSSTQTE